MDRLSKWFGALLLLVPILAAADPVRVSGTAQGIVPVDAVWQGLLLGGSPLGGPTPVSLTIDGEFDPDSPDFSVETNSGVTRYVQSNPNVSATLIVDGQTMTFNDGVYLSVAMQPDSYYVLELLSQVHYNVVLSIRFGSPAAGLSGDPLSPRVLSTSEYPGHVSSYIYSLNPDAPGLWDMGGQVDSAMITVSAIPEPSHAVMLLAGLLVLSIARHRMR